MMTHIDLQAFCGNFGLLFRECMNRPIHMGAWTIATNGHIAIRIPRLPATGETQTAPQSIAAIFDTHRTDDLGELPLFTPPDGECDCALCGGSGEQVDDDYGNAITQTCSDCNGSGKTPLLHDTSVEINGTILAGKYFELIRALPFPKLSYGYWPGAYVMGRSQHPMHFSFEGGIGLLIPMRGPYRLHFNLVRPGGAS